MAKKTNEYADSLGDFFTHTPKAVFAALAVSFVERLWPSRDGGAFAADWTDHLMVEWQKLHTNGIIPQKPKRGRRG